MKRFSKKLAVLLVMIVITNLCIIFCIGCSNVALKKCKNTNKTEIENYAINKKQDNYNLEQWNRIMESVETGKLLIDEAKTKDEVEIATAKIKNGIDLVEPKESEVVEDGAYFITVESWDRYLLLNSGINGLRLYVAIVGDEITLSREYSIVYRLSRKDNLYEGKGCKSSIGVWMIGGVLYIRDGESSMQFEQNFEYQKSDVKNQITVPRNVRYTYGGSGLNYVCLNWNYEGSAGNLGASAEIKMAGQDNYELVKISQVYMNQFMFQFEPENFRQGENFIRLYHNGGPNLTNDKLIVCSENSECITFQVVVDFNGAVIVEPMFETGEECFE